MRPLHFLLGAIALVVVMLIGFLVSVTAKLADSTIPLSDPWPYLVWAATWYLFLVLVAYVVDRVGA